MQTKFYGEKLTAAQAAIVGLWLFNILLVLGIWSWSSFSILGHTTTADYVTAAGRLFGLAAAFFALTQFMLMGRIGWLERPFGLDHLAAYHRKNGYYAIICILIHPALIALGYGLAAHHSFLSQYRSNITQYPYTIYAFIASLLFITVVVSSIYIVRRRLRFETWYYVHLMVYAAIVLAFFHQITIGGNLLAHPLAKDYWILLYAFVAVNLLVWRFWLPIFNLWRYDFRISRVVAETATITSVYIRIRRAKHKPWQAQAGQFVLVRILAAGFWREEHPFSISQLVGGDELRITVRDVGDYTHKFKDLKAGKRVVVSGPFGRFTQAVALTPKRLFIAGGVGITPLRPLIEEALGQQHSCILLYGNRDQHDYIFKAELTALSKQGLQLIPVFSAEPLPNKLEKGHIDGAAVQRLVPDFAQRDVYLCGPPPMMAALAEQLPAAGLPKNYLHFENFSLHS